MGPEFHEVVDRLEAGQSPEDIEQSLPEYFNESGTSSAEETAFEDF